MKITLDHVGRSFGSVRALDEVSLEIASGELFFLLGPSGCGKTTLLRALAGLGAVDAGRILFDDRDVTNVPPHRRNTAMVFQGYALWPHMTVAQNVAFGLEIKGDSKAERDVAVADALQQVQMAELAGRKPNELSGGQQQRVALARALVVQPACLLLDEPLANLDAKLRRDMRAGIRLVCKQSGLTAVYVTHDRQEALSMADRIAVMNEGRVMQVGPPKDVYARPVNAFVAGFVGETNFVPGTVSDCDAGSARVRTACGVLTSAVAPHGLSPEQPVILSIRPEALRVSGALDEAVADNVLQAELGESTYLGEIAEYLLIVNDSLSFKAFELNPRLLLRAGDKVNLSVDPNDVVVLPVPPEEKDAARGL